ncbi:sugar phosphate isomerase/epimerase [Thioclava sp. SK-1]|uniref:sugar phosphate isomerase/epimerase family protein n=1 Tax=Thioclava sp. SK-1 TaxID=1889770 RepID=UPI001C400003|nr:sugar phosphate isomerase/epimerase family protein [Thioclava sp. SK-1]
MDTILADYSLEEVLKFASENGFASVEVACWPSRSAEEIAEIRGRSDIQPSLLNYILGITHIDVAALDDARIREICELQDRHRVRISSLAYYANPIGDSPERASKHLAHYKRMIEMAPKIGVDLITTFMGRDQNLTVEANLGLAIEFWEPIVQTAEKHGVRIAIENCPMYFNEAQWPGGQNLMTTPEIWRRVFEAIPNRNFGLCYDPSHMIFQGIDYLKPIYEFSDRIFHVHFKDAKILRNKIDDCGTMGYPLQYTALKIPGRGDVNWGSFVSALDDVEYQGDGSIEVEDPAFDGADHSIRAALSLSKRYLSQYLI